MYSLQNHRTPPHLRYQTKYIYSQYSPQNEEAIAEVIQIISFFTAVNTHQKLKKLKKIVGFGLKTELK